MLAIRIDARLKHALVADAVKAAIGYVVPEKLRPELWWIYEQKVMCNEHVSTIRIQRVDDDAVIVHARMARRLENLSDKDVQIEFALDVDEWGHREHKSRVLALGYRYHEQQSENFQLREADNGHILRAELPQIVLRKGEDVQVWAEWEEAKRADDISHLVLKYPTTNVHITLEGDENMQIIAYIAHGHEALIQQGPRHYIFRGALLPRQAIFVRWYPVGA